MLWYLYQLIKLVVIITVPFWVMIRSAMYFHLNHGLGSWTSLAIAILITSIIIFIYFTIFYGQFAGRIGSGKVIKRRAYLSFFLVAAYLTHAILFFSSNNVKNQSLRTELLEAHPILRLSMSTLIHLDKELIITDASRIPEDYRKMGLPTKSSSLHYKQKSTGFSHAIDLRTKGRSPWKNAFVETYFRLMGFNTLRHVGTDDHLHVSIKSKDLPGAI